MSEEPATSDEPRLNSAYREYVYRLRTRSVLITDALILVGVPSGVVLDYFVYRRHVADFFGIRLAVDVLLLMIMAVLYLTRHQVHDRLASVLGIGSGLVTNGAFCLMIYLTDGARSPYYSAINMITIGMAIMLPWTVIETTVMCAITVMFYVVACVANPNFFEAGTQPIFAYNTLFILIATAVCISVTYFMSRRRFEDFRLRHQLDSQNRALQDLDRLKTQFFSNVSHELRTPLTLILGPVESMLNRGEALDSKLQDSLILVQRNSLRLLKLINDLLDLTRIDQGAETLRKKPVVIGPFVRGVVESVRHLSLSKKLRMRVEEDSDPSLEASVDPARMEKVIVNLLTNAIKYTPNGGTISARWKNEAGMAMIEISDTGVGIPQEDLGKVFNRFHQVQSNTTNQYQGVGIGLALVREIVEQHGGRIEVDSVVGKGSTFRVMLPIDSEQPAAASEAGPEEMPSFSEEPFERAFRSADRTFRSNEADPNLVLPTVGRGDHVVLVADDENDVRQYVVSLLSDDYRVVQTQQGGNVLDLVVEHEPDVVVLDWMMPGKDGLSVCRELRSNPNWNDLKILLLTARIDEKSKIDALSAGADDFLTKPFSSTEVKTRVSNLLRSALLQKDLRLRNQELSTTVEKLQRTEIMLIQSEKMNAIGSLSAGLLHEINNPLNYTMTAISIVHQYQDSMGEEMKELVADIEEGMVRIRDVITHLKHFAYPEKPDHLSVFPLADALRDARKISAGELDGIRIDAELPVELVVKGQKTQLTHLFINLLNNAARAMNEFASDRPKTITVRATTIEGLATIEVADSGPGIPPDILTRVFEPFFTTREVGSGMGMGLSICHTIMESHGGSIQVRNQTGGGAVFSINIPLAEEALKPC